MYRMAQNKPDYLLLLSKFSISTTKYVRVAPKTSFKAVLNVSSTGCNNERQSLAKVSYSAIDNVLTNLLPRFRGSELQVRTWIFKSGLLLNMS